MAISIKFTKFDNTPWGFRLAGGSDFPQPLTVIRVTEESLAERMGLKVGDIVVRLNDQSISSLTHGQAHEALVHAGNNFVLGIQREEEARKAAEALSEENIVPYKIALADLSPVFPEQILKEETVIERYEEDKTVVEPLSAEDEIRQEEEKLVEEKPVDVDSENVPNKNLTDDEIAQLILEEEELLSDKGLLGVNFKKLRPRAPILKGSKVLEELQHIATAEPERVQELKRTSTFLQKPVRPVPKSKNEQKVEEDEGESYKVVIKKQDKKTVIARLVEKGLLPPGSETTIARTPEPPEVSEFLLQRPGVTESSNTSKIHERRLSFKGRYLERVLQKNVAPVLERVKETCFIDDQSKVRSEFPIVTVNCIADDSILNERQTDESVPNLKISEWHKDDLSYQLQKEQSLIDNSDMNQKETAENNRNIRECDDNLIMSEDTDKCPDLIKPIDTNSEMEDALSKFLQAAEDYVSTEVFHRGSRRLSKSRKSVDITPKEEDDALSKFLQSAENYVSTEVFHRGSRRFSRPRKSVDIISKEEDDKSVDIIPKEEDDKSVDIIPKEEDDNTLSKFLQSAEDYVSTEVFHRGNRRLSKSRKSVDITPKEGDDNALSKFLQSAENYVSTEVFHRGSRRFSRPRKSVDIIPKEEDDKSVDIIPKEEDDKSVDIILKEEDDKSVDIIPKEEDDDALSKFLQSAENYVSTEVFHRGSRRFSRPRKSIDLTPKEDNNALSKLLQSAEDYVSKEVFHRRSRRFSKSRKSVDFTPKEDDALSKLLQSAEDYISKEVFHRRSRRFSKSRKSVDFTPKEDDALSKLLQSAEDYVSKEVFHRRSRRLSKSFKREEQEEDVLSSLLHSTGDYVSSEVFHRRSRRLSRPFRRESIPPTTSGGLWSRLKSMHFSLPWFSSSQKNSTEYSEDYEENYEENYEEKIGPEIERDNRRLSFVPTILYQGITNRIGIDFTKLVVYAFVPCTSIILFYMYK